MAYRFECAHCGAEIVAQYLRPGEPAVCASCDAETPVPEGAESVEARPSGPPLAAPVPPAGPDETAGACGDLIGSAVLIAIGVILIVVRQELAVLFGPNRLRLDGGTNPIKIHAGLALFFTGLASVCVLVGLAKFIRAVERRRLERRSETTS